MSSASVPTRSRRRSERLRDALPEGEENGAADASVDASSSILGDVVPQMESRRQPGETRAPRPEGGLAALAALPVVERHPLERFLFDRGVSVVDGARMIGVSRWTLQDWFAGRSSPPSWRATEIAVELGVERDDLFPPLK